MIHEFFNILATKLSISSLILRTTLSFFAAMISNFLLIHLLIKLQIKNQLFQPIRELGPESHMVKKGTPTMGGIGIVISILLSSILFTDLSNHFIWITLLTMIIFALLGFSDDYLKITKKNSIGIIAKAKILIQLLTSIASVMLIDYFAEGYKTNVVLIPFWGNCSINLGFLYIFFASFIIIGSSNAVNLTDGLDGLVTLPIILSFTSFAAILYYAGDFTLASSINIFYVKDTQEMIVFCSSVIGACLAFLWYNCKPAEIFMGDTGSLALGGALGLVSIIAKNEIILAIIGFLFVIEALSVIIQVSYFKITKGKRFFKMAPLHHHFEKSGWQEIKVVNRFWIVSIIFTIIGLLIVFF